MIPIYNFLKAGWSRLNDWVKLTEPRSPVPNFTTAEYAAAYIAKHIPYTGDWWGGVGDVVVQPERIQAAIERGFVKTLPLDCDDVATFAHRACRHLGPVQLWTLEDGSGKWMHHVILTGWQPSGHYAIDTNGFRRLPDQKPATLLRVWNEIYGPQGARYVNAVPTAYPF